MHGHWVISEINRCQLKFAKVFFVGIYVFKLVPIHPQVSKLSQVLHILECLDLVHCQINKAKLRIMFQILDFGDLILLKIELLKVD